MLDPQQEHRLAELFQQALDLPPEQRQTFLERVAADDAELAARLTALLAEDARGTHGVLAGSALGERRESEVRVGPYRLVRLLGEGGMGSVHLAEQDEPVQRTVALKTIRLGGGEEVLARFDAERRALARLEHPNVARIHEVGTTESGLPWFAMEYCPGRPLDDYCDHERLEIEDRLRLMLPVCDAVQHAHLRGVLHRDLKPANVLVTLRDGRAVPKVIDFGLARAVAGSLSHELSPAVDDRPVGTWSYVSPEQADPRGDVDARTDVWSLGAMLYELLCGEPPLPGESLHEVARRLAAERIQPASRRVLAFAPERAREVARARRTTPAALVRRLRGDLDAIVLRALEHDRSRRYSTPSELAADLQRHLDGEPVAARPSSAAYRLGKLVRRRKRTSALLAVAGLAVVCGLGYGWVKAAQAREASHALRAQVRRLLTDTVARSELWQIVLREDPELPLRDLLARAEPAIAGLHVDDPLGEAGLRRSLGWIWLDLGESEPARLQLTRAWDLVASSGPEGDIERFLILDGLIRAARSEGTEVEPQRAQQCVDLGLQILSEEQPALARALAELFAQARSASATESSLSEHIDAVAQELERDSADGLFRVQHRSEQALLVARALIEAAVLMHRSGLQQPTERLSRKLEGVAERALEPGGSAWLYFLWRSADVHLRVDPPLPQRAFELATRLMSGCRRCGFDDDHWMVREAQRLLDESRAAGASEGS